MGEEKRKENDLVFDENIQFVDIERICGLYIRFRKYVISRY